MKIADKISNLRDVATSPPADWSQERRRQYADWAKRVVDVLGPVSPELDASFFEGIWLCGQFTEVGVSEIT